jgi:hypothetical protein
MTDEFDPFEGATSAAEDEAMQSLPAVRNGEGKIAPLDPQSLPAGFVSARDLLPEGYDEDEGDFEPGGLYKGFRILPEHLWPDEPRHAVRWPSRFYVSTDRDTPGLVPWAGSQIVWPWERAWSVDLHRTEVQSLLKEEKGKHK